jgi:hypothetical protein
MNIDRIRANSIYYPVGLEEHFAVLMNPQLQQFLWISAAVGVVGQVLMALSIRSNT